MNLGRWDEARDHLLRARKTGSQGRFCFLCDGALDCLTGEAESAMENLKTAIHLRPENRYHARQLMRILRFCRKILASRTTLSRARKYQAVVHERPAGFSPTYASPMRTSGNNALRARVWSRSAAARAFRCCCAPEALPCAAGQKRIVIRSATSPAIVTVTDDGEARGVCGVNTASFLPAISAIAWSRCRRMRRYSTPVQYRFHSGRGCGGTVLGICFSPH